MQLIQVDYDKMFDMQKDVDAILRTFEPIQ